jgi:site-specific DNA-methyltransferase (adenine-specific)
MKQEVLEAFLEVRGECSADVVIADPKLNARFLEACRQRGLAQTDELLNRTLLNARKQGDLKDIKSKRVIVRNQEKYRYASEAAVRFLERRDKVTLDQILCDPERATEFDVTAQAIEPGFSSFEYRWAALGLRKVRKLKPELVAKVLEGVQVLRSRVSELDVEEVPALQGVYLFHDAKCSLYAGEASNLYKRVK